MDERLTAAGERIQERNDRALVIGACGIDDDVSSLRGARKYAGVVQRAHDRFDAEYANGVRLLGRANEAGDLMSGGRKTCGDRSADIARCTRAKDLHERTPTVIAKTSEALSLHPRCFLKNSVALPHASSAAWRSCTDCRCSLTKACSASYRKSSSDLPAAFIAFSKPSTACGVHQSSLLAKWACSGIFTSAGFAACSGGMP